MMRHGRHLERDDVGDEQGVSRKSVQEAFESERPRREKEGGLPRSDDASVGEGERRAGHGSELGVG